jgi:hypothetical protein
MHAADTEGFVALALGFAFPFALGPFALGVAVGDVGLHAALVEFFPGFDAGGVIFRSNSIASVGISTAEAEE